MAWGDFDETGSRLVRANNGANMLYQNDGDGTFSNVTSTAGVGDTDGNGWGTAWADYDGDGDLDLYGEQKQGQHAVPERWQRLFRRDQHGRVGDTGNSRMAWGDYTETEISTFSWQTIKQGTPTRCTRTMATAPFPT